MKIAYIILENGEKVNMKCLDNVVHTDCFSIKDELEIPKLDLKEFTHAIIIPNDSEITENYFKILEVYYKEGAVMLPLTVLSSKSVTGVLNNCIWNPNLTSIVGELEHELAIKQIDLTLFGALIPVELLVEDNFNADIKHYQHFYFLNKITYKDVEVIGIPKTLAFIKSDLALEEISNEEKIKYFNMAKDVYPAAPTEIK